MYRRNVVNLILLFMLFGCSKDGTTVGQPAAPNPPGSAGNINYRQEMRKFVKALADYARARKPGFIVIPQNGPELLTNTGEADNSVNTEYANAINGIGVEDVFYGDELQDDKRTPDESTQYNLSYLDIYKNQGLKVLVADYCSTPGNVDDSYSRSSAQGYISFAAPSRGLEIIPSYPKSIFNENNADISTLSQARNFLYLINTYGYASKSAFLDAIRGTNYDIVLIDAFYDPETTPVALTQSEITSLKTKANGASRLVICYLSIGEAESYRYYWQTSWNSQPPKWMRSENPDFEENFVVDYWDPEWQAIITGNDNSYLKKILDAGFDGIYLDIVDGFFFFEELATGGDGDDDDDD